MYFISIVMGIIMLAILVLIGRTIYVAFIKKKDEQEKLLVMKAMAQSFVVVLVINIIQAIIEFYNALNASNIRFFYGLDIHPSFLSIIILGVFIIYYKRKTNEGM